MKVALLLFLMSTITITETVFPNYQRGGAAASLRIFADETFVASSGQQINRSINKSNWYKSVSGTVSSNSVTIPAFTIDSTTDSSNPQASYSAAIYDSNGNFVNWVFRGWQIPHDLGTSISWSSLNDHNEDPPRALPDLGYTQAQTIARINEGIAQKVQTAVLASANLDITNDDVLSPTDLSADVESGGVYSFDAWLLAAGASAAGLKIDFDGGSAVVGLFNAQANYQVNSTDPAVVGTGFFTAPDDVISLTGHSVFRMKVEGTVHITTAGTFTMQAAQVNTNGTPTTLYRGSRLTLIKLN